ncbi:MAG: hypothetical protein WEC15_03540 [Flavobacteriales bacterium]
MKSPKESTLVFEGAQHQLQDPVLVFIAQGSSTPAMVAVEWRDGAGELHYADLCTDANENWRGSMLPVQ